MENTTPSKEIEELQSRLCFQEDLLARLDTRIAEQEKEIELLQKQLQHVYSKLKTMESVVGEADNDDAPPPHY